MPPSPSGGKDSYVVALQVVGFDAELLQRCFHIVVAPPPAKPLPKRIPPPPPLPASVRWLQSPSPHSATMRWLSMQSTDETCVRCDDWICAGDKDEERVDYACISESLDLLEFMRFDKFKEIFILKITESTKHTQHIVLALPGHHMCTRTDIEQ